MVVCSCVRVFVLGTGETEIQMAEHRDLQDALALAESIVRQNENRKLRERFDSIRDRVSFGSEKSPSTSTTSDVPSLGEEDTSTSSTSHFPTMDRSSMGRETRREREMETEALDAAVVNHSLRNENDLLRSQLRSLSENERNLRREIDHLKGSRATFHERAREARDTVRLEDLEDKQRTIEELERENSQLLRRAESLQSELSTVRASSSAHHSHRSAWEGTQVQVADLLSSAISAVDSLQRHVLPNYRAITEPESSGISGFSTLSNSRVSNGSEDSGSADDIIGQLKGLMRGIDTLKLVVDAKVETMEVVRRRLKDENIKLRAELDRSLTRQRNGNSALRDSEVQIEREREELRTELAQLQELYNAKLNELNSELVRSQANASELEIEIRDLRSEVRRRENTINEIASRSTSVEQRLVEDESSRLQLASEVQMLRLIVSEKEEEIETLRLAQKFLKGGENGRIPQEKVDLMRMCDRLLKENKVLKEQSTQLQADVNVLRRQSRHSSCTSEISPLEIDLVADDRVSDTELMSKILRQKVEGKSTLSSSFTRLSSSGNGIGAALNSSGSHSRSLSQETLPSALSASRSSYNDLASSARLPSPSNTLTPAARSRLSTSQSYSSLSDTQDDRRPSSNGMHTLVSKTSPTFLPDPTSSTMSTAGVGRLPLTTSMLNSTSSAFPRTSTSVY